MKKYNVGVVGVGAVGVEILRILKQRNFPIKSLRVFARSARDIRVDGQKYSVEAISDENFDGIEIALFAGTEGEKGAANLYAGDWVPDLGNGKYKNPVLFADYSDPDVIRVGDDFYLVASSFNCMPGIPVLRSKDLVNWKIIGHVYERLPFEKI